MRFLDQNLSQVLLRKAGLHFTPGGHPIVEQRLQALARERNFKDSQDIIKEMARNRELEEEILSAVTIHETLWFRDSHPFQNIFEALNNLNRKGTPIKVWSGACSTGQEPYSLKMTQLLSHPHLNLDILGTDICQASVQHAKNGLYDSFSMSRGIENAIRNKYFISEGSKWRISPQVQRGIRFEVRNLKDSLENLPLFDLILLRNVIIYFPTEMKTDLINRIVEKLRPGGLLLLGGCESIIGYSSALKMKTINRTTYYEKVSS